MVVLVKFEIRIDFWKTSSIRVLLYKSHFQSDAILSDDSNLQYIKCCTVFIVVVFDIPAIRVNQTFS